MSIRKRLHSINTHEKIKVQKTSQSNVKSVEEEKMRKQNVSELTKTTITSSNLSNSFNS